MFREIGYTFLVVIWLGMLTGTLEGQPWIRKVQGLPAGRFGWYITRGKGFLYLVYLTGRRDVVKLFSRSFAPGESPFVTPFPIACIDPEQEQVVKEWESKHWSSVAIMAEKEQRIDSWLAHDYAHWVINAKEDIAFALKPKRWDDLISFDNYLGVDVISLAERKVLKRLRIPSVFTLALTPDGRKLYASAGASVWVVEVKSLKVVRKIHFNTHAPVEQMRFGKRGRKLFCLTSTGLFVINVLNDQLEYWEEETDPPNLPINFGVGDRNFGGLAIASDGEEIYLGLYDGFERGGVAAVDIDKRRLVRLLELSQTACGSIAVVSNKLFAACLDGVYVIDIPEWRKQNDK